VSVELTVSVTCAAAQYLGHRGRETENRSHVSTFGWRVFSRVFKVFEPIIDLGDLFGRPLESALGVDFGLILPTTQMSAASSGTS
jgi:hypothetical protein